MNEGLVIRHEGTRCDLVLSRPERGNSLSPELVEALHDALDHAEHDSVRLVVISGEGRNFCTGFDLTDIERFSDADLLARFVRIEMLLARLWSAPFATLAVAQGHAFGAGADLFASCANRVARLKSMFSFPGAGFGLVLGTRRLAARIGQHNAETLVASGEVIDAAAALRLGLATEIIEDDGLEVALERVVATASRLDVATFAAVRSVLVGNRNGLDTDLADLVRSAARPGLAGRMLMHRKRLKQPAILRGQVPN